MIRVLEVIERGFKRKKTQLETWWSWPPLSPILGPLGLHSDLPKSPRNTGAAGWQAKVEFGSRLCLVCPAVNYLNELPILENWRDSIEKYPDLENLEALGGLGCWPPTLRSCPLHVASPWGMDFATPCALQIL